MKTYEHQERNCSDLHCFGNAISEIWGLDIVAFVAFSPEIQLSAPDLNLSWEILAVGNAK